MERKEIKTDAAPSPSGTYSQGIAAGGFLFLAGQAPQDPVTKEVTGDIEQRIVRVLENLKAVAEAGGAKLSDAVSLRICLEDLADMPVLNEVLKRYFDEPYPVRATVQAGLGGLGVEIDAIIPLDA